MKSESQLPRIVALVALAVILVFLFTGCVSNRYKEATRGTPRAKLLNAAFGPAPLEAVLTTLITYNGPGSWKRDACWDEYLVTLHNPGKEPLNVSSADLADFTGKVHAPGTEPWALEKLSKTIEQQYKDAGLAFMRYTAPGLLMTGVGAAVISNAGVFSAAAGTAFVATLVVVPAYYVGVLTINHYNKVAMEKEFSRRRLELPLILAPGETRMGSLFFPMLLNPRSLGLEWSISSARGECTLPLDFLHGLHVAPAATK